MNKPKLQFDTASIFPKSLEQYSTVSILGKAQARGIIRITNHDLRDWSTDKHHKVDDTPYGGGPGMVIRVDVVHRALKSIVKRKSPKTRIILMSPRGETYTQQTAHRLASYARIVLIAGRYEAIDARIDNYIDEKISLGNFILTGGELAAACVIDSVARLIPGVIGKEESLAEESFSKIENGMTNIEYPQYTKPEIYDSHDVPSVLLSGNHAAIRAWRRQQSGKRRAIGG